MGIGGNVRSDSRERSIATHKEDKRLLQLRVLRLGFLQDGDVGVGVLYVGSGVFVGTFRKENGAERFQAARPRSPATRSPSSNSMRLPSANSISFLAASKLGA